jgi:hypothetical protein
MHYNKCRVLAWQRIIIYIKESMFSAIKNHKKKKVFHVKFSTLFRTNSFLPFCNGHVIIMRTESTGTGCRHTREKARDLNVHDWPAGRARSVKISQRSGSCDAVCQSGTYTTFTGYEVLHASPFLTLFIADKNLLWKITLQTSPHCKD